MVSNPEYSIESDRRLVLEDLRRGGMSEIFIVYDKELGEVSVIKTYRDDIFTANPSLAPVFEREALAWIRVGNHPNVVRATSVEMYQGRPLILLDYVPGTDLSDWIGARLSADLAQVLKFSLQFCDGMIHILSHGILAHRDIKPRNCLINKDHILKITDFGLARTMDELTEETTHGTLPYMSPEHFRDYSNVAVPSDVYSFGVLMYEMAVGRPPFMSSDSVAICNMHFNEIPSLPSTIPDRLAEIILKCLEKKPDTRYQNFSALRCELATCFELLVEAIAPSPSVGPPPTEVEENDRAVGLLNMGFIDEALLRLDRSLEINPDYAPGHSNRGLVLAKNGDLEGALTSLDHAIVLDPMYAAAFSNKGTVLGLLGRYEEELNWHEKAIELDPNLEEAWLNKGVALQQMSELDEALDSYDRAISLYPRYAKAWFNRGTALGRLGRHEEAVNAFNQATAHDPTHARAWYSRGVALGKLNRTSEELESYDRAINADPSYAMPWYNKGYVLGELGRPEEEIECYSRAIDADPEHTGAILNKGIVLGQLGRVREAQSCFERVLDLDPHDVSAQQNLVIARNSLGNG